jgi:hypothetical protein
MVITVCVIHRPYELFTQLHALSPKGWSDEAQFVKRYCSR